MAQKILIPMIELKLEEIQKERCINPFKELVLAAVAESLSSIGESAKQKIYSHLKEHITSLQKRFLQESRILPRLLRKVTVWVQS